MGSGPSGPGRRGFRALVRPRAFVPDVVPPVQSGAHPYVTRNGNRHPSRFFRFPKQRKAYEVYGGGSGALSGYGAAGAATFVLSLEPGTSVTYAWSTDVYRSYSGNEQRSSPFPSPKQRFEGVAFLVDSSSRDARGTLQRAAAAGSTFLLAVPYEEVAIVTDTNSATVAVLNVGSTAGLDWALPTQRVIVLGGDGTVAYAVIQSVASTTISVIVTTASGSLLFTPIGTPGLTGGRVMPLVQVLLDPQQGFARHPVTVDEWSIRCAANVFGWTGADSMGLGAQLYTYTNGGPQVQSRITDADLLVWDRPNLIDGTAEDSMLSGAETLDMGALPAGFGDQTVPDWSRPIRYVSSDPAEWQWLKAMLRFLRGRQRPFLLSTNRPDLVYVGPASGGGIKVQSSSVAGGGDYASWYTSLAHRRLAITDGNGTITYVTVTAAPVDNGDGTLTLMLDNGISGTPALISLAEQLRIDNDGSDDITVTWEGGTFTVELTARAVQETITTPLAYMFDTTTSLVYAYNPPPAPPTDQEFAPGPLGQTTLLNITLDRGLTFGGIVQSTAPADGTVICIRNNTPAPNAFGANLNHEDTNFSAPDRFWLFNRTGHTGVNAAIWLVYSSVDQRWIQIGWNAG
jgi:hypothetical protein